MSTQTGDRIIVALDNMEPHKARETVEKIGSKVSGFKANDLMDSPSTLEMVVNGKLKIDFADAKFHDTPGTVKNRVIRLLQCFGDHNERFPKFLTVHASGGIPMMTAALEAADEVTRGNTQILGITVLTSIGEEECQLTFGCSIKAAVLKFSRWACGAGLEAIVCSGMELKFLAGFADLKGLDKVTPAIRPKWFLELRGQSVDRVMTPGDAIKAGATQLVMGSPITQFEGGPEEAIERTLEEIEAALREPAATAA